MILIKQTSRLIPLLIMVLLGCSAQELGNEVEHTFTYHGNNKKTASVAGSFNNWSPDIHQMTEVKKGVWELVVELPANFYQYKLVVDGNWITDPANDWKINDGGDGFNSIVKIGDPAIPARKKSPRPFPKEALPRPILENNPEWVELYYSAWEMAWNKISQGTPENGFEPLYMDEGFNELIYQWDLCFITSFAIYGREVFPVMPSLDNFYNKQRSDGYIQRVYWETDGTIAHEPSPDEPMVNPPLFAWIEWRYYEISGDASRFKRVLPILEKYFEWSTENCRTDLGKGLYYNTPLGSGMDNTPRQNVGKAGWIDYSAQQALAALYLSKIADVLHETQSATFYRETHQTIKTTINQLLWDEKRTFYYDLTEADTLNSTMHIGAFWTLVSEVCPPEYMPELILHLKNPAEFWRPHLVPTLAANQPEYDPKGHYWLGSIWAPTNYMLVQGLMANNQYALADSIAINHLASISEIYYQFKPEEAKIAFDERYADSYQTLWECYAPESLEPATRWDNTFYSRQDFVGWSGLGPIAMLIENILGFEIRGSENTINWCINRSDTHGIENMRLGNQKVSLIFKSTLEKTWLEIEAETPFMLKVKYNSLDQVFNITEPTTVLNL